MAHLSGITNRAADATSRHPVSIECNFIATMPCSESDSPDAVEETILAAVQQDTSADFNLQWSKMARETVADLTLKELLLAIDRLYLEAVRN